MRLSTNGHPHRVHVVGVHSCRGGTGRTTLAANFAFLAARSGARVGVVDCDLQAPSLHAALCVQPARILHSVAEFVRGRCDLDVVPIDLTRELGLEEPAKLYLLPAWADLHATTSILFDGYDVSRLNEHLRQLAAELELDFLVLDTHLGFNRETLLSLATSDTVMVLLRPDGQDRDGASVLLQIADKVGVPSRAIVPNLFPPGVDAQSVREEAESRLKAPVAGVLPWCPELAELGCKGLFAAQHPEHPFTAQLEEVLQRSFLESSVPLTAGGRS